jgi:16S rRNA (cytosine967-C5)-methyltransferase
VQDEASQWVGAVLSPSPTDWIWDMCAGGGGKSLHLAAIMNNQGRVVATDIHAWKLDELKKRAKRAGVYNIFPADLNRLQEIRTVRETGFDKILVDAPCSGTGTIRRNPDLKWKLKPDDFSSHHRDQIELVRRALPLLRPGGKLYYATCSLDPEENESVIREAIEAEKVKAVELAWPGAEPADPCGLRFRPDAGETDGFFLAGLEKL